MHKSKTPKVILKKVLLRVTSWPKAINSESEKLQSSKVTVVLAQIIALGEQEILKILVRRGFFIFNT